MRHRVLWAAALCIGFATPALANPHVDRVIAMLQAEGYTQFEIERTWLGRIRIEAENGSQEREIVLNRSTGEILRDYVQIDDHASGYEGSEPSDAQDGGTEASDDERDDEDDGDQDEADDDADDDTDDDDGDDDEDDDEDDEDDD